MLDARQQRGLEGHQFLVIVQVYRCEQDSAEHLVGSDEMMQIGARKIARRSAGARFIDRSPVLRVARVLEIDRPEPGEREPMAAVAGRQYEVEHVDPTGD